VVVSNKQRSRGDYCEFALVFKETKVDYKNGNTPGVLFRFSSLQELSTLSPFSKENGKQSLEN